MTQKADSAPVVRWTCPEDERVLEAPDVETMMEAVQLHFEQFPHESELAGFTDDGPVIAGGTW